MTRLVVSAALGAVLSMLAPVVRADAPAADSTATNPVTEAAPVTTADYLERAHHEEESKEFDAVIEDTSHILDLDPKNADALELRGEAYVKKTEWDFAERDYLAAQKLNPDPAFDYALGEVHYLKKDYTGARPHFAAVADKPRIGDLCAYMVFLCDALGGHDTVAAHDLAAFRQSDNLPSYYFAHIAWDLIHGQHDEANTLFTIAHKRFGDSVSDRYIGNLMAAQRFRPGTATFETRSGEKYENVTVSLGVEGLRFKPDQTHWVTLPVTDLTDDLSGFPADLREQISAQIAAEKGKVAISSDTVSFTTKSGKAFNGVRYMVEDAGLAILTSAGWLHIPFAQLPDAPDALPPTVRAALTNRQSTVAQALPGSEVLSFTSKSGKDFIEQRCSLGDNGVTVVTDEGWVIVPFSDLPTDLSPFPDSWQTRIKAGAMSADDDNPFQATATFTTRKGRRYADVRTSLGSEGLRVVTENGWVVVPYQQLPEDLSPFPPGWRDRIRQAAQAPVTGSGTTP